MTTKKWRGYYGYPPASLFYNWQEVEIAAKEARINTNSLAWEKANLTARWEIVKRRNYLCFLAKMGSTIEETEEESWKKVLGET